MRNSKISKTVGKKFRDYSTWKRDGSFKLVPNILSSEIVRLLGGRCIVIGDFTYKDLHSLGFCQAEKDK